MAGDDDRSHSNPNQPNLTGLFDLVSENISDQLVLIQNPDPVVAFFREHTCYKMLL